MFRIPEIENDQGEITNDKPFFTLTRDALTDRRFLDRSVSRR